MADSLSSLSSRLAVRSNNVRRNVVQAEKDAAKAVLRELVFNTPVDTGEARSNWLCGVGDDPQDTIDPFAPGRHLGLEETANADAAINAGEAVLDSLRPGQSAYISNNVPYIELLNQGWSAQSPAGFIERAIQAGQDSARNARYVD